MERLNKIDDFLVDGVFQRLADALWDRAGNCFCVALICLMGFTVFTVALLLSQIVAGTFSYPMMGLEFMAMMSAAVAALLFKDHTRSTKGPSPFRARLFSSRVLLLATMVILAMMAIGGLSLAMLFNIARMALYTAAIFFASCSTRPPMRRVERTREVFQGA